MVELAGYYDGNTVRLLDKVNIKKFQYLKIIVTDDFIDQGKPDLTKKTTEDDAIERTRRACQKLLSFQKPGIGSDDYKKDLTDMLEQKYESIN